MDTGTLVTLIAAIAAAFVSIGTFVVKYLNDKKKQEYDQLLNTLKIIQDERTDMKKDLRELEEKHLLAVRELERYKGKYGNPTDSGFFDRLPE